MDEDVQPALVFINDRGGLKFRQDTISVHKIIKDIIYVSMLSAGKKVRVAFFYQNDSFDAIIPYCLEMLYQTSIITKQERNYVLVFCGKLYSFFKSAYKDSFFGQGNFCNHLFGLAAVTPSGSIRRERKVYSHRGKSIKDVEDKFLFSSSYSFFPDKDTAKRIMAVVIVPPSLPNMHKIPQICQWCDENGIPIVSIFDPYPTAGKIKFYGSIGFIAYGWRRPDLKDAAVNAPSESTPLSNPGRLLVVSDYDEPEVISLADSRVSQLFNSLNTALNQGRRKAAPSFYERDILMEATSLSRRLAALSTPLLEYDKEYFGSMFRKSLSERVDNFVGIVETATGFGGVLEEMEKAAYYFAEIKKDMASTNPKFNEMATQIGKLVSSNHKAVVLIPTQMEANSFLKALGRLRVPITEEEMNNFGVEVRSFNAAQSELESARYDLALLSTYPFLDKNYLLGRSIANQIKIILYPCEKSDYKFFNSLYSQIEDQFFSMARRKEINSFLSGKGDLNEIRILQVRREGEKAEVEVESGGKGRPKNMLDILTDMEKTLDVSAPSLFQESVSSSAIRKDASGVIKTQGLVLRLHTGDRLYLREGKTVQVVSASDDVSFKLAKDLGVGETLAVINRDMRMSLNDLILEKAGEYPKLKVLQVLVSLWVSTLKEGMLREGHTVEDLLQKMNGLGAGIKSEYTIKHWVNGEVIGPRDLKNILRIAEIYKSDSLNKNAKAAAASITQMRGLRRTIFMRAKNALVEGKSEEMEKLDIDLSDFADAIEFFRVESIEKVDDIPIENLDKIGGGYEI